MLDLITSGRRIERRSRKIREVMAELDYTEREAIDLIDAEAEDAEDERREIHGGTRPEYQYRNLGINPNYDSLD